MRTLTFAHLLLVAGVGIAGCSTTPQSEAAWEYVGNLVNIHSGAFHVFKRPRKK